MPAAAVVFAVGVVFAYTRLPDRSLTDVSPVLLVIAAAAALCTTALNGAEYGLAARFCGRAVAPFDAFRVSVLSSAANSLPLPGAVVVKTSALHKLGSTYGLAIRIMAAIGLVWVGTAGIVAGVLNAVDSLGLAMGLLALGFACFSLALVLFSAHVPIAEGFKRLAVTTALELVAVALTAGRLLLTVHGIGYEASWAQAFALAAAAIVATAVGLFPAGLGLREVLSAGTAELAGLPPAVGLMTAAVDRIVLSLVLALVAVLFAFTSRTPVQPPSAELESAPRTSL